MLVVQVSGLGGEDGSVDALAQKAVAVLHHLPQERARHIDPLVPAQTYIVWPSKTAILAAFSSLRINKREASGCSDRTERTVRARLQRGKVGGARAFGDDHMRYEWMYNLLPGVLPSDIQPVNAISFPAEIKQTWQLSTSLSA